MDPHIGFTGTSEALTADQMDSFWKVIGALRPFVLHHGDCVVGDAFAHGTALKLGQRVHLHPPSNPAKRAFCEGWTWCDAELPYLERNRNIVRLTSRLLAMPRGMEEVERSGTWSTVRFARGMRRPVTLVLPDGSVRQEF